MDTIANYDVELYHSYPARSTRVKWLLYELGIDSQVETKVVDVMRGEQNSEAFRRQNAMRAIPTLRLVHKRSRAEVVVSESAGICMFLTEFVESGVGLRPATGNTFGMGVYQRVMALSTGSIDPLLWDIRKHEQLLPARLRVASVASQARKLFSKRVVPTLDGLLGDGMQFVCHPYHSRFTTADVMLAYCLMWAEWYDLNSAVMKRYVGRMKKREAFLKTVEQARLQQVEVHRKKKQMACL